MEGVDVEVGLRVRLRLAHVAQDRLHVGERLLVERADIAVEAAPVRIREQRLDLRHRGDELRIDSETAGDRVALQHLARRRGMREDRGRAAARILRAAGTPRAARSRRDRRRRDPAGEIRCASRARRRQAMACASFARRACRPRRFSSGRADDRIVAKRFRAGRKLRDPDRRHQVTRRLHPLSMTRRPCHCRFCIGRPFRTIGIQLPSVRGEGSKGVGDERSGGPWCSGVVDRRRFRRARRGRAADHGRAAVSASGRGRREAAARGGANPERAARRQL